MRQTPTIPERDALNAASLGIAPQPTQLPFIGTLRQDRVGDVWVIGAEDRVRLRIGWVDTVEDSSSSIGVAPGSVTRVRYISSILPGGLT